MRPASAPQDRGRPRWQPKNPTLTAACLLHSAYRCARMGAVNYFPVFFDLKGQNVLVVGGGDVALRKISLLERSGAVITLVAPEIVPELRQRGAAGHLKVKAREFVPSDLDGARLVIVATSRRAINRWIAKLSDARAIPVNVVDDRE